MREPIDPKHTPVLSRTDSGVLVKLGEIEHPMEDEHYIMWIQLKLGDKVYRQNLTANDKPEFEFELSNEEKKMSCFAVAFCNVHGLWDSKVLSV